MVKADKVIYVAMRNKYMTDTEDVRCRQSVVVPQVKEQGSTFQAQMNIQPRIAERTVHQTSNKRGVHVSSRQGKTASVKGGNERKQARAGANFSLWSPLEHHKMAFHSLYLILD